MDPKHQLEECAALGSLMRDALPLVVWVTDCDLRVVRLDGSGLPSLPLPSSSILGMTLWELFRTRDPEYPPIAAAQIALSGDSVRFDHSWLGIRLLAATGPVRSDAGAITGTITAAMDRTEQARTSLALFNTERRLEETIESSSDIIYTHDAAGRFLSVNRAGERILGYKRDELIRLRLADVLVPEQRDLAHELTQLRLRGNAPRNLELVFVTRTGDRVALEVTMSVLEDGTGTVTGIQAVAHDVTQRVRLNNQLREARRLEAVGALTGGAAHEFNNLLTGILGSAHLLEPRVHLGGPDAEAVLTIIDCATRGARLSSRLLEFARLNAGSAAAVDMHAVAHDIHALLTRSSSPGLTVGLELEAKQHVVPGSSDQLYQMLLNLCLQAREAAGEEGEVRIRTLDGDGRLVVSVHHRGSAQGPPAQDRITEPFFGTREAAEWKGLELAIANGIARAHGGTLEVESNAELGTGYYATLPLGQSQQPRAVGAERRSPRPCGRILVIDDEPVVRRVLSRMLTALGVEVAGAADSVEALQFYETNPDAVDLVILDVLMPRLGGRECLDRLRAINPGVRAVVSSGSGHSAAVEEILSRGLVWFLPKPYTMATLSSVLGAALDAAPPTAEAAPATF